MGKQRKAGKRVNGRLSRAKGEAGDTRVQPTERIIERRNLFAFVNPTKGPDGRVGEIDQDICDGIGQLHALGLLDGHGIDPQEMRDKGRLYGELWWSRYSATAPKTGDYERASKSTSSFDGETGRDRLFARMDEALSGYERGVLMSLIVDKAWGDDIVPWAKALIDEALLARGKVPKMMRFPDMNDRALLEAAIRGLCLIVDGALPQRWERNEAA